MNLDGSLAGPSRGWDNMHLATFYHPNELTTNKKDSPLLAHLCVPLQVPWYNFDATTPTLRTHLSMHVVKVLL